MLDIRLRAERRIGEMLGETIKLGNPKVSSGTTLPDDVTRDQSSKWQRIAWLSSGLVTTWPRLWCVAGTIKQTRRSLLPGGLVD